MKSSAFVFILATKPHYGVDMDSTVTGQAKQSLLYSSKPMTESSVLRKTMGLHPKNS